MVNLVALVCVPGRGCGGGAVVGGGGGGRMIESDLGIVAEEDEGVMAVPGIN